MDPVACFTSPEFFRLKEKIKNQLITLKSDLTIAISGNDLEKSQNLLTQILDILEKEDLYVIDFDLFALLSSVESVIKEKDSLSQSYPNLASFLCLKIIHPDQDLNGKQEEVFKYLNFVTLLCPNPWESMQLENNQYRLLCETAIKLNITHVTNVTKGEIANYFIKAIPPKLRELSDKILESKIYIYILSSFEKADSILQECVKNNPLQYDESIESIPKEMLEIYRLWAENYFLSENTAKGEEYLYSLSNSHPALKDFALDLLILHVPNHNCEWIEEVIELFTSKKNNEGMSTFEAGFELALFYLINGKKEYSNSLLKDLLIPDYCLYSHEEQSNIAKIFSQKCTGEPLRLELYMQFSTMLVKKNNIQNALNFLMNFQDFQEFKIHDLLSDLVFKIEKIDNGLKKAIYAFQLHLHTNSDLKESQYLINKILAVVEIMVKKGTFNEKNEFLALLRLAEPIINEKGSLNQNYPHFAYWLCIEAMRISSTPHQDISMQEEDIFICLQTAVLICPDLSQAIPVEGIGIQCRHLCELTLNLNNFPNETKGKIALCFLQAIPKQNFNISNQILKAKIYMYESSSPLQAIPLLLECLKNHPIRTSIANPGFASTIIPNEIFQINYLLVDAYFLSGDIKQEKELLYRLTNSSFHQISQHAYLTLILHLPLHSRQEKWIFEAVECLKNLIDNQEMNDFEVLFELAFIYFLHDMKNISKDLINEVISPGYVKLSQGEQLRLAENLSRRCQSKPEWLELCMKFSAALILKNKRTEALSFLQQFEDFEEFDVHYKMGRIYFEIGKADKGLQAALHAFKLNQISTTLNLVFCGYLLNHKIDEAVEFVRSNYVSYSPGSLDPLQEYTEALLTVARSLQNQSEITLSHLNTLLPSLIQIPRNFLEKRAVMLLMALVCFSDQQESAAGQIYNLTNDFLKSNDLIFNTTLQTLAYIFFTEKRDTRREQIDKLLQTFSELIFPLAGNDANLNYLTGGFHLIKGDLESTKKSFTIAIDPESQLIPITDLWKRSFIGLALSFLSINENKNKFSMDKFQRFIQGADQLELWDKLLLFILIENFIIQFDRTPSHDRSWWNDNRALFLDNPEEILNAFEFKTIVKSFQNPMSLR